MKTDTELKALYLKHAPDMLPLTGDQDATFLARESVELSEVRQRVDCVVKLRRGGEVYYRHIEFQGENDTVMAERCFLYNSRLQLQLRGPVLTTVIYLFPPGPPENELVYRVALAGREINAWRFEVARLWESLASEALASGAPGLLALVPLMSGGERPDAIRRADRAIRRALPDERSPDALVILHLLAGRHYTVEQLESIVGSTHMLELKQSSLYQALAAEDIAEGEARGVAQGVAQGKLEAERDLCLKLVKKHYPALLKRATRRIEACTDYQLMQSWILSAGELDSKAFARLLRQP